MRDTIRLYMLALALWLRNVCIRWATRLASDPRDPRNNLCGVEGCTAAATQTVRLLGHGKGGGRRKVWVHLCSGHRVFKPVRTAPPEWFEIAE